MIVKCILLALSASIDALGLGITYGIKKTKMSSVGNLIIFVVLFCLSGISVFIFSYCFCFIRCFAFNFAWSL